MSATPAILAATPAYLLQQWQTDLGVEPDDLTVLLAAGGRTIQRWRNGTFPQRKYRERLLELQNLYRRLLDTFDTPEDARSWLHANSRYLGGLAPVDALRGGRIDSVNAALSALEDGAYL